MATERLYIQCPDCKESVYLGKTMNYGDWYTTGLSKTTLDAIYEFIGQHYLGCKLYERVKKAEPAFTVIDELTYARVEAP